MKSSFPCTLGARITGVGAQRLLCLLGPPRASLTPLPPSPRCRRPYPLFDRRGATAHPSRAAACPCAQQFFLQAFSTIVLPNAESTTTSQLQADDVSLGAPPALAFPIRPRLVAHPPASAAAYEFARKFVRLRLFRTARFDSPLLLLTCALAPLLSAGYTADNRPRVRQPSMLRNARARLTRRSDRRRGYPRVQARRFVLVSAECARMPPTLSYRDRSTHAPLPRSQPPDRLGGAHAAASHLPCRAPAHCCVCAQISENAEYARAREDAAAARAPPSRTTPPSRAGACRWARSRW